MAVHQPPMETQITPQTSRFLDMWEKLSFFLEKFNLIPVAVVVSVYHYYQALKLHDPFFVALPIAMFVDILHYRTVQQAARTRQFWWGLSAVASTAMVFTMQYIFYSAEPITTTTLAGQTWNTIVFASIVPVGVAMMAILHETGLADAATTVQAVVIRLQDRVTQLQDSNTGLQSQVTQLQDSNGRLTGQVTHLQGVDDLLQTAKTDLAGCREKVVKLQGLMQDRDQTIKVLSQTTALFDGVHPIVFDILTMLNGVTTNTQKDLADKHGWSESKVSRMVNLIKG